MTPAEMREAAAVVVEDRPIRLMTEAEAHEARADLAAAIRALPLPEEALTPREKLRRVDDMRLATEWSGTVSDADDAILAAIDSLGAPPGLAAVLSALPHLTGDELRRVAEAMPRVAGGWTDRSVTEIGDATGDRMERPAVGHEDIAAGFVRRHSNGSEWVAVTPWPYCYTTHPTARAAQAACDARLEAAGVRLCGEVVRG